MSLMRSHINIAWRSKLVFPPYAFALEAVPVHPIAAFRVP